MEKKKHCQMEVSACAFAKDTLKSYLALSLINWFNVGKEDKAGICEELAITANWSCLLGLEAEGAGL